jgi:hypothetical protein
MGRTHDAFTIPSRLRVNLARCPFTIPHYGYGGGVQAFPCTVLSLFLPMVKLITRLFWRLRFRSNVATRRPTVRPFTDSMRPLLT